MKLDDWLSENKRSVAWLARQVGRHRSVISRVKDGIVDPPGSIVAKIEEATGGQVTAADLVLAARPSREGVAA